VVREHATREHFHALFSSRKKIEQFRKDFRKNFPDLKGNSGYSLKDVKSEIGIQDYICKGDSLGIMPEVLEASPMWDETKIKGHHESYWNRHEHHKSEEEANVLAKTGNDTLIISGMKTKVRTPTFIEKVANKLRKQDPEREWQFRLEIHRKHIYRTMMESLGESGKAFDKQILKRLFNGVCLQLCEAEVTEWWEESIVNPID